MGLVLSDVTVNGNPVGCGFPTPLPPTFTLGATVTNNADQFSGLPQNVTLAGGSGAQSSQPVTIYPGQANVLTIPNAALTPGAVDYVVYAYGGTGLADTDPVSNVCRVTPTTTPQGPPQFQGPQINPGTGAYVPPAPSPTTGPPTSVPLPPPPPTSPPTQDQACLAPGICAPTVLWGIGLLATIGFIGFFAWEYTEAKKHG